MRSATRALTIFAELDPDMRPDLESRLRQIHDKLETNDMFRPGLLPDTHFMRFAIIDDDKHELPALLAWEVNHDGDARAYLAAAAQVTPSLDHVFECCLGYPGVADRDAWLAWMLARRQPVAAFYVAYPGVPRREVANDIAVHREIRALADTRRAELAKLSGPEIQRALGDGVAKTGLDTAPIADETLRWFFSRALAILAGVVLLPALLVIIVPWFLILRSRERAEGGTAATRPVHSPAELLELEDRIRQNQLTHVVDLKPGRFRMFTLWSVLHVIGVLASVFYVNGHLGGITSIHFARWVILRDRRSVPRAQRRDRLVFFSNYDGSWESYLGEFIDRASTGLTAIWSNTEGFPRAKLLMFEGATDEEAFKQWTRDHQRETQVWWSGVPVSTVQNVRDDIWLRRRLARTLDAKEMAAWLRRV